MYVAKLTSMAETVEVNFLGSGIATTVNITHSFWMINTANVIMQSHRTAKYVAFHNCNSPQSFQKCMQKPEEHIYN